VYRVTRLRATNRRVTLSRDRIIARKRTKLTIIAAAGALTVATAASAAAAARPSASPASPVGGAFSSITVGSGQAARSGQTAAGQRPQQNYLAAQQFRVIADHQALTVLAHQQAMADQAAKRKAQAELAARQQAARQAAQQAAAQQASSQQASSQQASSQQAPSSTGPAASGSVQSIAQAMLGSFGWSSSQFSCLEPLWAGESGWSLTASNPSSGAYGIPQALPGSKMASAGADWQTSAATQIRWGLGYIKGTYGSPCAAWSHEQADSWY